MRVGREDGGGKYEADGFRWGGERSGEGRAVGVGEARKACSQYISRSRVVRERYYWYRRWRRPRDGCGPGAVAMGVYCTSGEGVEREKERKVCSLQSSHFSFVLVFFIIFFLINFDICLFFFIDT